MTTISRLVVRANLPCYAVFQPSLPLFGILLLALAESSERSRLVVPQSMLTVVRDCWIHNMP